MNKLSYSEIESRRFDKEIFRGKVDVLDIDVFHQFYRENDPDVLIVRMPVSEQHKMAVLNTLNKDVINADTLVYYQVDLKTTTYSPVNHKDFKFEAAHATDKEILDQLIAKIFVNYTNHYFSNPVLDKEKITKGYMEWAISTINAPNNFAVLMYKDADPIAFIICSYDNVSAEIILNGVLPGYQGMGVYTHLIRYVKAHFRDMNMPVLKVSTQIQNFAVQKVWNKEGLALTNAFCTVHLNKR